MVFNGCFLSSLGMFQTGTPGRHSLKRLFLNSRVHFFHEILDTDAKQPNLKCDDFSTQIPEYSSVYPNTRNMPEMFCFGYFLNDFAIFVYS